MYLNNFVRFRALVFNFGLNKRQNKSYAFSFVAHTYNKTFMRKLFYILILFLLPFSVKAERFNYIIIFDCTESMKGKDGGPNIWIDAQNILEQAIQSLRGTEANIIVIPFQHNIGTITEFSANDPAHLIDRNIDKILSTCNHMITSKHAGTSICRAWDAGLQYIDENCKNYICLLTDGYDNIDLCSGTAVKDSKALAKCTEEVCTRIREWCGNSNNNIAFYSRLTQDAQIRKIEEAAIECSNFEILDGLNIAQLKTRIVSCNIRDFNHPGQQHEVSFKLSDKLSGNARIEYDDPHFDLCLSHGRFENGSTKLIIKAKQQDYNTLRNAIGKEHLIKAKVYSEDKSKLNVLLNDFAVSIKGDPEEVLNIDIEEDLLGKVKYYPKFWWRSASSPDTLSVITKFAFNDNAKDANSSASIRIQTKDSHYDFFCNGKLLESPCFTIDNDSTVVLSIVMHPEAEEGRHSFILSADSYNLDRVNNVVFPEEWDHTLTARYTIIMNPLKKGLIIISCIVLGLFLLWLLWGRQLCFPRFRFSIVHVQDGRTLLMKKVRGYRSLVITSSSNRQGWFNRLLTGQIQYVKLDGLTDDIIIIPRNKNSAHITQGKKKCYLISPTTVRIIKVGQTSEPATILNTNTKKMISIKIQ